MRNHPDYTSAAHRLFELCKGRPVGELLRDEHATSCPSSSCREHDWPCRRLPNGWRLHMWPMIYTQRLAVSSPFDGLIDLATDGWCYDKRETVEALIAFLSWDGTGDPPGPWIKHLGSGRKGPGAAAALREDN